MHCLGMKRVGGMRVAFRQVCVCVCRPHSEKLQASGGVLRNRCKEDMNAPGPVAVGPFDYLLSHCAIFEMAIATAADKFSNFVDEAVPFSKGKRERSSLEGGHEQQQHH